MFELILTFAAALLLVATVAARRPGIRTRLARPRLWISIVAAASILSLTSTLHSTRRQSGTGWQSSFGWPKAWCGRWESFEDGSVNNGYNFLYFAGNVLFYMALLLTAWLLWSFIADAKAPAQRECE